MSTLSGQSSNSNIAGVFGEGQLYNGVRGVSHGEYHSGVIGVNDNPGDKAGPGVWGVSRGAGVRGQSSTWHGVVGLSESTTGGAGLYGENKTGGSGVRGQSSARMALTTLAGRLSKASSRWRAGKPAKVRPIANKDNPSQNAWASFSSRGFR